MVNKKEIMVSQENHKQIRIIKAEEDLIDFDGVVSLLLDNYNKYKKKKGDKK